MKTKKLTHKENMAKLFNMFDGYDLLHQDVLVAAFPVETISHFFELGLIRRSSSLPVKYIFIPTISRVIQGKIINTNPKPVTAPAAPVKSDREKINKLFAFFDRNINNILTQVELLEVFALETLEEFFSWGLLERSPYLAHMQFIFIPTIRRNEIMEMLADS